MKYKEEIKIAFKVSIPVFMGYSILGFAFGLLMVSMKYDIIIPIIMSIFIYAGALQFLAIGFFSTKLALFDIFIASIFVNIRQAFYGLSVLEKFKDSKNLKPYLIFALTDETYGLITSIKERKDINHKYYYFFLSLFNQFYWVMGTTLGALFASYISFDTNGLEFSLTALFVVLAIEQYKVNKNYIPFLIGAISSILAITFLPIDNMLIASILISLVFLFIFKKRVSFE
jgi:4-azaleucine resistance transporter AzlC